MNITQKYLINGPNNVIRLTNDDKVIYIFGDYHLEPNNQVECAISEAYETLDIDKFLIKFFKTNKTIKYDLFVEMENSSIDYYKYTAKKYRSIYIHQVRKILGAEYTIKDNKVIISKNYPNIRFHYFDFRVNFLHFYDIQNLNFYYIFPYTFYNLINITNNLSVLISYYENLLIFLSSNDNIYVNKIKNKYNNPENKKKFNFIYNLLVIKFINEIILLCKLTLKYINKNEKNLYNKFLTPDEKIKYQKFILSNLIKISHYQTLPYAILTDLYLLRRIIDKNYTKNNIIYCGLFHFIDITVILVKLFDYKISNLYYSEKITDINKTIQKIKLNDYTYMEKFTRLLSNDYNDIVEQCVNLFDFPPNFT